MVALRHPLVLSLSLVVGACSFGVGAVGSRHEMPKRRSYAGGMPAGWYPVHSTPWTTTYRWQESTDGPGGTLHYGSTWGLGFGLRTGVSVPDVPGQETSFDRVDELYGALFLRRWTFEIGDLTERGDTPDGSDDFDEKLRLTGWSFDVGRRIDLVPMSWRFDLVPHVALIEGSLNSFELGTRDVRAVRPGLRLLKVLQTGPGASLVLTVDARYTYSRELQLGAMRGNYRAPSVVFELGLRL